MKRILLAISLLIAPCAQAQWATGTQAPGLPLSGGALSGPVIAPNIPLNVVDYNVACNGVTTNTTALQSAENLANAIGATLVFPTGTCLTGAITKKSNVYWQGQGEGQTIIKAVAGTYSSPWITGSSISSFGFSGLTLDMTAGTSSNGLVSFALSTNWYVSQVSLVGVQKYGIVYNGGSNFNIQNSTCNFTSSTNTQNECILGSSASGQATQCLIDNNRLTGSGMDLSGLCAITRNYVTGWGYGAGITVESDANTYSILVADNWTERSLAAPDVNGTYLNGYEIWAPSSIIRHNRADYNCGDGLDFGGQHDVVEGNYALDNGVCAHSGVQNGIAARYKGTATNSNANFSILDGNQSWDDGAGTQLYGYADQSSSLANISYGLKNQFFGVTAPTNILSTTLAALAFSQPITTTTPITASVSTGTVSVVAGTGDATGTPVGTIFRGPDASGTNITGANIVVRPGAGTGSGTGGSTLFYYCPAGTTGSAANTCVEAGRIQNNNGKMLLGGASGAANIQILGNSITSSLGALALSSSTGTTNISDAVVNMAGIAQTSAAQTGTVCRGAAGLLTYDATLGCLTSSGRFKTGIKDLHGALTTVMQLHPVSFQYKDRPEDNAVQVGLIAEEVNAVDPRLVGYEPDGVTPRGVRYAEYTAMLTKAIQEQQAEIDELRGHPRKPPSLWCRVFACNG